MAIFLLFYVKTKKAQGTISRGLPTAGTDVILLSCHLLSIGLQSIEFEGWGLVTPIWGPISLNPLGGSYGKLDFRCKWGFLLKED